MYDGARDGAKLNASLGLRDGKSVISIDGASVGITLGVCVGLTVGFDVGSKTKFVSTQPSPKHLSKSIQSIISSQHCRFVVNI